MYYLSLSKEYKHVQLPIKIGIFNKFDPYSHWLFYLFLDSSNAMEKS